MSATQDRSSLQSEESLRVEQEKQQRREVDTTVSPADNQSSSSGSPLRTSADAEKQQGKRQVSFFAKEFKPYRLRLFKTFPMVICIILFFMIGIFSIYWGSMWKRETRYVNLKMLVVLEDDVQPFSALLNQTAHEPTVAKRGGWHIVLASEISEKTGIQDAREAAYHEVHKQQYWAAIFAGNASSDYTRALKAADSSYRLNGSIEVLYETGRDMLGMQSYVVPSINIFEQAYIAAADTAITEIVKSSGANVTEVVEQTSLLSQAPSFKYTDYRPVPNPVILAPSQIGLLYLIILTFFQVNFFIRLHNEMAHYMDTKHYIIYRLLVSHIAYLIIALGYSCVSAAFQISFNATWKGGFGVQWMVSYLNIAAAGGANENMALITFAWFPPIFGFWLIFWVIINISSTFAPIALCPDFYRFGYMTPVHNAYEITKVVLFDTYRGQLGRNFGILVAWIALHTALFPLCIMFWRHRASKPGTAAWAQTRAPPPFEL